jgi:hypothetical protein
MKRGDIVIVQRVPGECYSRLVKATKSYVVVDFCGVAVVFGREDVSPAPKAVQP